MPRRVKTAPSYRRHRRKGRADLAYATIDGNRVYLGEFGTPESKERYRVLTRRWSVGQGVGGSSLVAEAALPFLEHVRASYGPRELDRYRTALRYFMRATMKGEILFEDVHLHHLAAARDAMCRSKKPGGEHLSRGYISALTTCIKSFTRWAVNRGHAPASVLHEMQALEQLPPGYGRHTRPSKPVPWHDVEAVLPHVSQVGADMIRTQALTGMRPSEMLQVRPCDITDMGSGIWHYKPARHKTQRRGFDRVVVIGPACQEVLRRYMDREPERYCFEGRGDGPYQYASYLNLVRRGQERANAARAKQGLPPIPHWSPNQLRKLHGQRVREQFGLEAAQRVLGHSRQAMTERYYVLPIDEAAARAQRKIG